MSAVKLYCTRCRTGFDGREPIYHPLVNKGGLARCTLCNSSYGLWEDIKNDPQLTRATRSSSGVKPLSDEAKAIISNADNITVDTAEMVVHDMVAYGNSVIGTKYALKLLQEVQALRARVEPQNADHQQIVYALERARDRLQRDVDSFESDDYNQTFPADDKERMEEAIAILTKPQIAGLSAEEVAALERVEEWFYARTGSADRDMSLVLAAVNRLHPNIVPAAMKPKCLSVKIWGVSRMGDNSQALLVSFRARPTDDDIRNLHELIRENAP